MFATLLGALPSPPVPEGAAAEAGLDARIDLQMEHGLEPLTAAGWSARGDDGEVDPVGTWRAAAGRTGGMVKAVVPGPWSSHRPVAAIRGELLALVDGGCRWIEVHEPAAATIGPDPEARARFSEAHQVLTDGFPGVHLSLALTGGSADTAGIETILVGAYASLAVDLIEGPDNWRLVAATPGDRGIVCGVIAARPGSDDRPELPVWAAGYAASTGGRGMDRVGLATAGSLVALTWEQAVEKVRRLGEAARLAAAPPDELARRLDPRAVDIRSAGLGRYDPPAERLSWPRRGPRTIRS